MKRARGSSGGSRRAAPANMSPRVIALRAPARLFSLSERAQRLALAAFVLITRLPLLISADFVSYDGTYYINQAKALLHGSLGGGAFPLGYPLLIAPVLAIVRDGVLAAGLVSVAASIGSVLVFESICRRRLSPTLSLFA